MLPANFFYPEWIVLMLPVVSSQVKPLHKMPGRGMAIQLHVNHEGKENVRNTQANVDYRDI